MDTCLRDTTGLTCTATDDSPGVAYEVGSPPLASGRGEGVPGARGRTPMALSLSRRSIAGRSKLRGACRGYEWIIAHMDDFSKGYPQPSARPNTGFWVARCYALVYPQFIILQCLPRVIHLNPEPKVAVQTAPEP